MENKKEFKTVPITLLTGYLGSGKTTLINYILNNQKGYKVAVIVNDIGEVNIDADLIQKDGFVQQEDSSLVPLSNGCICCTLKTDLMQQIVDIVKAKKFDYILIEASGICEPVPIAQTITMLEESTKQYGLPQICRLDNIVSVVDAFRLSKEFGCGAELEKENIDDEDIENLIIQQIEFCNTIVLNKVDEVSEDELNKVKAVIKRLQPSAKIIETNYSKVDMDDMLDTMAFDFEQAATSAGWLQELNRDDNEDTEEHHHDDDDDDDHHEGHHHHHHDHDDEGEVEEYGIGTFVYTRRRPFSRLKFEDFVTNWPRNVIRCKGVVWFSNDPDMSYVFEQAGPQKQLGEAGTWVVAADERQRNQIIRENPDIMDNWDETYGDRIIKLVFIGQKMDKEKMTEELDNCLGTMRK